MTPENLQQRRQAMQFSCEQMGDYLGVSAMTVSNWENGKFPISKTAVKLLYALRIIEELQQPKLPLPPDPGFCQCGCGGVTKIATRTDRAKNWKKGEPLAFLNEHNLNTKSAR
jgi:transcriptional regulator with XRE-family HTH domain